MRSKIALAATALAASFTANAQPAMIPNPGSCFYANQFENWKPAGDKTIYVRVTSRHFYRLDLAGSCPSILAPGAFLVTKVRGSNQICSAVDWNLQIKQSPHDIPEPCIVDKMTPLSDAEAAAIPAGSKP